METDGFQLVSRKKGKRTKSVKGIPHEHHQKTKNVIDENYILRSLTRCRKELKESMFWDSVAAFAFKDMMIKEGTSLESAQSADEEKTVIEEIVCFGLGSVSDSVASRYQLALLLCLKDLLQVANCMLYDPIFTESEKEVMRKLDLQFLGSNEEGAHSLDKVTLVYMPHCGRQLFNNLFWANWSPDKLTKLVLLSNSLSTITESTLNRILQQEFSYIKQVTSFTQEREIPNVFQFKDIFNDMSVHTFSLSKLRQMTPTFWKTLPKPQYSETLE